LVYGCYYSTLDQPVSYNLNEEVTNIKNMISEKLNSEFKSEHIQLLIEDKAKEHTKNRVENYISLKVNETITPFSSEIKKIIADANDQFNKFKEIIDLDDRARFGSRKAYNSLCKLENDNSTYEDIVDRRIVVINRNLSIYQHLPLMPGRLTYNQDGKDIDAEMMSTKELFDGLEDVKISDEIRNQVMSYIVRKPKIEVYTEALRVLKNSDSLFASAATCGILYKLLGEKAEFLDFDMWTKICEQEISTNSTIK
jgi:hypothetical protein